MDEHDALKAAVVAARLSPCAKSKRGVVIWSAQSGILAARWNSPPVGFTCDGSQECRGSCGKVAVHAEQSAILDCHRWGKPVTRTEMLHVKVGLVNGSWDAVTSGGPSCPDCSKLILEAGITGMWLYEEGLGGPHLVRYTPDEFHRLTLKNCNLHPYEKEPLCATDPSSSASADEPAMVKTL